MTNKKVTGGGMKEAGFTARQIKEAGFTAKQLAEAGFPRVGGLITRVSPSTSFHPQLKPWAAYSQPIPL